MKKHKPRKKRVKPDITIRPTGNGGFIVDSYNGVDDSPPLVFMAIDEVLEHLLLTYAEEN